MAKTGNINAFILAGGESMRMKSNKALLQFDEKTLLEIIYEKLTQLFENVFISTSKQGFYDFIPTEKIPDIHKKIGPLGGMHACLQKTDTERNFFISCDLPFVSLEMISAICNYSTEKKIVVPVIGDYKQYMCGMYDKSCFDTIEKLIAIPPEKNYGKNKNLSMRSLLTECDYDLVPVEKLDIYYTGMFLNLNTKAEYKLALYLYKKDLERNMILQD